MIGKGGGEQITGHVAQSLMQSKLAGGIVLVLSWEFTRENVTQRSKKDHFVVMRASEKKLTCFILGQTVIEETCDAKWFLLL